MDLNEIDEPIRGVILRINKLGYKTTFSCAGYDYPNHIYDEKERDKRQISDPSTSPYISFKCTLENAWRLAGVIEYGWTIELSRKGREFILRYSTERVHEPKKEAWKYLREALTKLEEGGKNEKENKRRITIPL